MSDDDDLRLLMRSPALTLEPPAGLPDVVRRRARRHRRRVRTTSSLVLGVLVGLGILLGPGAVDSARSLKSSPDQTAGKQVDRRAPQATTEVVTMRTINGAQLLTWFEGTDWCTATTRVTRQKTCLGAVDPEHQGFSWIVPSRSPSVTVDDQHVVAGITPRNADRVIVHMKDGREFEAAIVDGRGFPLPVWSALLVDDTQGPVEYYAAYDQTGREIARKRA
jgi:hypothetical protein